MKQKHEHEALHENEITLATMLAALRLFQRTYADCDGAQIAAEWPDHFTRDDGTLIAPLGNDNIDALCEALNYGSITLREPAGCGVCRRSGDDVTIDHCHGEKAVCSECANDCYECALEEDGKDYDEKEEEASNG